MAGSTWERPPGNELLRDGVSSWGKGLVPRGSAAMGSQSPQKARARLGDTVSP